MARWQKMGPTIDEETANLRRGLAAGKVATARGGHARARPARSICWPSRTPDWPLRAPAAAAHAARLADAERPVVRAALDAAIAQAIRPAFERYREVLRAEILPRARDEAHAGLLIVPGGAACYASLIKVHTSLELPADEIHRIGLEELARIHAEMAPLGDRVFRHRTSPRSGAACAAIRRSSSRRATTSRPRRGRRSRARGGEPRFLGSCRARRAW